MLNIPDLNVPTTYFSIAFGDIEQKIPLGKQFSYF
jgi:hypothetical protein